MKVWFTDFYDGFDIENNYFINLLKENYEIEISANCPDYLIYSCYGNNHFKFDCIKIFYTGENLVPDFNLCDYAIGFHYLHFEDRYLRYPNFALIENQFKQLCESRTILSDLEHTKPHFCNFIYANAKADPRRDRFFHLLNNYKQVDSPGSHLNNTNLKVGERNSNDWMYSKLNFQSKCKFTIAFENSSSNGYTTEKIMHAFISGTIPIYWGNPEIEKDFNSEAFINCHNFKDFNDVVERVKEVDQNDSLYLSILAENPFLNNSVPEKFEKSKIIDFFKNILDQDISSARRRPQYGTTKKYENSLKVLSVFQQKVSKLSRFFRF